MAIQVGDKLPETNFAVMGAEGPEQKSTILGWQATTETVAHTTIKPMTMAETRSSVFMVELMASTKQVVNTIAAQTFSQNSSAHSSVI